MSLYDVVYADPPWEYRVWKNKESRTADSHYNTMRLNDIKNLPINDIASKNSVLLLWSTYPNIPRALDVMLSWGFRYVTVAFTWVKLLKKWAAKINNSDDIFYDITKTIWHFGLGHHTRGNPEVCLLGAKGKGIPVAVHNVRNLVIAPFTRHSEKPFEIRDRIDQLYPAPLNKIELFARENLGVNDRDYPDWTFIGDDIDGKDIRYILRRIINRIESVK